MKTAPGQAHKESIARAQAVGEPADDLGRLLGGGAHLRNLRRTAVGSFTVDVLPASLVAAAAPPISVRRVIGVIVRLLAEPGSSGGSDRSNERAADRHRLLVLDAVSDGDAAG